MPAKKLENLLKSGTSGKLEEIIRTASRMDSLTSALRTALDPDLADNLLAASIRDNGELVLICQSSAWASRLRFEADALLEAAAGAGFDARAVRVAVSQDGASGRGLPSGNTPRTGGGR